MQTPRASPECHRHSSRPDLKLSPRMEAKLKRGHNRPKYTPQCICVLVVIVFLLTQYVLWTSSIRPSLFNTQFFPSSNSVPDQVIEHRPANPVTIDGSIDTKSPEQKAEEKKLETISGGVRSEHEVEESGKERKQGALYSDAKQSKVREGESDFEEQDGFDGKLPRWELPNEESISGCESRQHAIATNGTPCIDLKRAMVGQLIYITDTDKAKYLYCGIPKNGCTYHLALQNRLYGEDDYEAPYVVHNKSVKWYKSMFKQESEEIARMLTNSSMPKYLVVRNPLRRTLSAYLDKVQSNFPEENWSVELFHKWVYEQFPKTGPAGGRWLRINPHWRPQLEFCGYKVRDIQTYFKVFRVEEPQEYVDFLYEIVPDEFLSAGWGKGRNISFREHALGPRRRTGNTDDKFLKYYNKLEVFDHIAHVLQHDIRVLGYSDEVARLRESVKKRESGE